MVIPTKTVPQGITAMISLSEDRSIEENLENAKEEIADVKSAQITYAVRNTTIDDVEIHENDVMALGDGGIIGVDKSIDDAAKLCDELAGKYPKLEFELHNGGQPVYYYFISVE